MDDGVRPVRVAAVFGIGLVVVAGILYLWWPAGVVVGVVLGTVATILIGRRLQDAAESVPDDLELLELLDVSRAPGSGRVTRTVLATPPAGRDGGASIR